MGDEGGQAPVRRLAAVWFADVAGFTALSSRDERASLRLIERFEGAVRAAVTMHGGTIVKFLGDGALAHFPSTESAVRAALQLRDAFADADGASVRVGVHLGDILIRADADVLGDGVNTASRIQSLAAPGEVIVSEEVWRQLRHTGAFGFERRGSHQLKGLPERREVWAVGAEGAIPAANRGQGGVRKRAGIVAAVAVAAAVALFAWFAGPPAIDVTAGPDGAVESLVVLPFDNLSGDPAEDYFVAGMHDALIGELTELGSLRVISRTSAMRYRGSGLPLAQIARELDVEAVVAASVLRSGDNVRIRAELIRVFPREESLWARSYDREMRDVLALHSEVAKALADAIDLELTPRETARLARTEQVNPEAYLAYMRGRDRWNVHTPQALDEALHWFETALSHDPSFAPAYAGIASVWYGRRQLGIVEPVLSSRHAKAAALRALDLDPDVARAHEALAVEYAWHDWDWASAERHFRRALDLQPGDALTRAFFSVMLRLTGRLDEGIEHSAIALRSDPYNPIVRTIDAGHPLEAGDAGEAMSRVREALGIWPDHPVLMRDYITILEAVGRHEEALAMTRRVYQVLGDTEVLAAVDGADGFADTMARIATVLMRRSEAGFVPPSRIARYHLWAGDIEAAVEWVERAVAVRDHGAAFLGLRGFTERLGNDPRYVAALEEIGLR